MSRTIELDTERGQLVLRFDYDKFLVDEVKTLPDRRWDKGGRCWRIPARHVETVVEQMMKHGFIVDSQVMQAMAGTLEVTEAPSADEGAKPAGESGITAEQIEAQPLTVSALNDRVRDALRDAFPQLIQVVGETVGFDKNSHRKHIYFQLVERPEGAERARAVVDVAMFERTAKRELAKLERAGLELKDGVEILIDAKVDLYPPTGRYQLILEGIRPEFTLGKMALSREQILERLREADLATRNLELPMPRPALRIGVLTSESADGWIDFRTELARSGLPFEVVLKPIAVQGEHLRPTALAALDWFAEHSDQVDLLCILRGGGSKTDLASFDDEQVAFAVAKHPLKVLIGIGHERDRSVLDEIATSLKTPTALAAHLTEEVFALLDLQQEATRRLERSVAGRLDRARDRLRHAAVRFERSTLARLQRAERQVSAAPARLARGVQTHLERSTRSLHLSRMRLHGAVTRRSERERASLDRAEQSLRTRALLRIERAGHRLDRAEDRRRLLDPHQVLRRGFAVLRDARGERVIPDLSRIGEGDEATLQLRDGNARIRIGQTTKNEPQSD